LSTYTHAKALLARVVPWPEDGVGYVNIHYTVPGKGNDLKTYWNGTAIQSPGELPKCLDRILKTAKDVYFCTSLQSEYKPRQMTGPGYSFIAKDAFRSQANVISLKSLFVDLDVKDNAYKDTKEALTALNEFCAAIDLPKPQVAVLSGTGGAHCYWVMDEPLSRMNWQPLATALAKALVAHNVKCDVACTVDSARILRLPETFNHKKDPPLPVKLLLNKEGDYTRERLERALKPYMPEDEFANWPKRAPLGADELSTGIPRGASGVVVLDDLECPFIKMALAEGGAGFDNHLWNQTNLIAVFTEGGVADAHRMGRLHPGYEATETDRQYERKVREQEEKDLGWPSCDTIRGTGCSACKTCPLQVRSPLNTAKRTTSAPQVANLMSVVPTTMVVPQPQTFSDLPAGYRRDPFGRIEVEVVKDDGSVEYRRITSFRMDDAWAQKDPWVMHFMAELDGRTQSCNISWEATATADGVPRALSKQGLSLRIQHIKDVRELLVAWMEKLRDTKNAIVSSSPFGWCANEAGKLEGFSYAGQVWLANGDCRPAASPDTVLAKAYEPIGDLQPWIDAAKMTTDQKRPELDAILAGAFAGPLVRFTGREGLIVSAYSTESGIGKTSTMKISQAVWGHPRKGMQGLSDTQNSAIRKLGILKHLPFYWDELKTEEQLKSFTKFAFQVSEGQEKGRLNRTGELREQGDWQTLCMVASNDSLMDAVTKQTSTTTAGIMRLFEFPVKPRTQGRISDSDASRMIEKLNANNGQVGLLYAKFLGANIARVDTEVGEMARLVEDEVHGVEEERYWIAAVACLVQGAKFANELGVTDIDVDALKAHLVDTLTASRKERKDRTVDVTKDINVMDILARYMNFTRATNTLFTDKMIVGVGKPKKNSVKILRDATKLGVLYVHIAEEDERMRLEAHAFGNWLAKENLSRHIIHRKLTEKFDMKRVNGKLGAGTDFSTSTMHLLELDLTNAELKKLMDN
jgi:hypothetical protein